MEFKQCQYVFKQGRHKGEQCTNGISKFPKYCAKHHRQLENKASNKDLNRQLAEDPIFKSNEPPKRKTNKSVFLITINTNKDYTKMSNEQKKLFNDFGTWLFGEDHGIKHFLIDSTNEDNMENIIDYDDMSAKYEVGEEFKKLHFHAMVVIEHTGKYQIDTEALRGVANKIFGYTPYINVRGRPDTQKAIIEYASKYKNFVA